MLGTKGSHVEQSKHH